MSFWDIKNILQPQDGFRIISFFFGVEKDAYYHYIKCSFIDTVLPKCCQAFFHRKYAYVEETLIAITLANHNNLSDQICEHLVRLYDIVLLTRIT